MNAEQIFAERLRELRLEAKLSTRELAKKLGVSNASISRWENCVREPNLINIIQIAKFFNVSTDYLCGLEN